MNYIRVYWSIIHNRLDNIPDGYVEHHHIIPRSEGGPDNNDNIVALTAREHYICHLLLAKIYNDYKMLSAVVFMQCKTKQQKRDFKFNSHLYECVRKDFAEKMSIDRKGKYVGKDNWNYGKSPKDRLSPKMYEQWRNNLSKSLSGINNPFYGKHHSEETVAKMKKPKSDIAKQHMCENHYDCSGENNPMFGRDFQQFMTPEAIQQRKQKCSQARKGKTIITNGVIRKMWSKNMDLPEGWTYYKRKKPAN